MNYLENTKLEIPKSRSLRFVEAIQTALNFINYHPLEFEFQKDLAIKVFNYIKNDDEITIKTSQEEVEQYLTGIMIPKLSN